MSLAPSIVSHLAEVQKLVKLQRAQFTAFRAGFAGVPGTDRFMHAISDMQLTLVSLQAECNWIRAELAAAQMTGEYAKPALAVTTLELHPANLPHPELPRDQAVWTGSQIKPQGALSAEELLRMQASLHRAGDHTLDVDDGEEVAA